RLVFPIRDVQGRTIAFGGRILPGAAGDNPAKYINSPETKLFSKSDNLYALDLAREPIAKMREGEKEIVVVEGYTDVIMAHQVGVDHVVAVLGTALGPRHIQLLRRFVDRVILVLDGDEAGQKRTNEILELFVAAQIDLRILTLPEELDPCEFLLERGAEPFLQMLGGAVDALEHKTRTATRGIDLMRETHQANQALEDILATIAKAPAQSAGGVADSRLREQQFLSRLARQFGLPEQELRSRVNELRRKQQGTPGGMSARPAAAAKPPALPKLRDLDSREIELLEILVVHPELAELALREIEVGQLKSECVRIIYRTIHGIHDAGGRRISG
nr:toprim domain-containing protein [Pirellulaceae bacterium]